MTKDVHNWTRESALRLFGKQPSPPVDLVRIIECIIDGKDIESESSILILPEGWESQFRDWIDQAGCQGNTKRKEELEALSSFFSFSRSAGKSREDILVQVEEIRRLCHKPDSPAVQSFVLGSLGSTLVSHGLVQLSSQLTEDAVQAARRGGMRWADLQWSVNLALFRANDAPGEADRELRRLLLLARNAGDQKRMGTILNNLASINEKFLSNLDDAIRFQEEAVAIARRTVDKASELKRLFHLAHLQEQVGQIQSAIENYDRGLALDSEIGLSEMSFNIFRHVSQLVAEQYSAKTKEALASHFKIHNLPHSSDDLRVMLEHSKMGEVMSSWDPNLGSVYFTPDNSFAGELSVRKEWEILVVYACQWMEQGFLAGDNRGFYWLSVALRSLGYAGAADEALQIGMNLPRAFEKGFKSEDRKRSC